MGIECHHGLVNLIYLCRLMSRLGGMTDNSSKKDIEKLINHWYLESLTDTQLIQLHLVGSSFNDVYMLCNIFQFIPIQGGKLYGLLITSMGTLYLLNQSYFNSDVCAL
jgi:hypothetical protein